jgi:hypothetical protein
MVILKLTLYSTGTASREYSQSIHIGHRHEKWLEQVVIVRVVEHGASQLLW